MDTINRVFYVMTIFMAVIMYLMAFVCFFSKHVTGMGISVTFAVLLTGIVKYWES